MSDSIDLAAILEECDLEASADDLDTEELLEEFGRMERARGIAHAFEAANEGVDDGSDEPAGRSAGLAARVRAACVALSGRTPYLESEDGDTTLEELAEITREFGDVVDERAGSLQDELESRSTGTNDDLRGFQ